MNCAIPTKRFHVSPLPAVFMASFLSIPAARADVVTDWNIRAGQIVGDAKIGTPPAVRVMALVQTAVHDAVVGAARRGASVDAAVATAHRATLVALLPQQQAAVEQAVSAALAALPEGTAKEQGAREGARAAAAVLAARADEMPSGPDTYRPHAAPGQYVPTAAPAATAWVRRKPWLMASPAMFRPGPPPALTSETWVRDYNEVKAMGGKTGSQRSAEQTEVARFWDFSLPAIYHGVLRSVALAPGRDVARNARLFATAAQAMDDAMIAVLDAKYAHNFWRPVTAIRNGDLDGHDATTRDASWTPFIDTPMHPEYPSAHSILASTVGTLLKAEIGDAAMPVLATTSPTANGATRRWTRVDDFVNEVADARVWDGVHYRFSTDVGTAMGRQIGDLAAQQLLGTAAH
jgi:hypothetical protein